MKGLKIFRNNTAPSRTEDVIGWVATALVLFAYASNALNIIESESALYILSNLFGGAGVMYIAYRYKNYQSSLINLVWIIVAIIAIFSFLI